jgi:DHA2 family multidrug resistance protein
MPPITRARRKIITASIILATMLQTLDSTIANVALPHMQGELSASTDQISWVLTSYLISGAIVTPALGWITSRIGRRRLFIISMAGFIAGSLLCGLAQNLTQIVFFRLLQGVFGAGLVPLSQAVIMDMYEPHERGGAMSIWAAGVMVGPILGPTLGAWLTESYSWRYVFYVNLPVGILGLAGMWFFLPASPPEPKRPFGWSGFASLAIGIAALQLVLDRGETKDWFSSPEIMVEATIAAIGFYFFIAHMLFARRPFITRALFRDRNFTLGLVMQAVFGNITNAMAVLLPGYLQNLGGYPVMLSGIAMAPRGIGMVLVTPITGRLIGRVDARLLIGTGLAMIAVASWSISRWTPDVGIAAQVPVIVLQGAAMAFVFTSQQSVAFATLPAHLRTEASALTALMRNLAGSAGVAVMETLLARNTQIVHAGLAPLISPFNRALTPALARHGWDMHTPAGLAMLDQIVARQSQIIAYADVFLVILLSVIPGAMVVLWLKPPPRLAVPSADDVHVME